VSAVALDRPWLAFDLGTEMRVLSWAVARPGFVRARQILWREVRDADLTLDLDVEAWLGAELAARGAADAVTFLTSRDLDRYTEATARADGVAAHAVATVGLSNAERVGRRMGRTGAGRGTINVALRLDGPLTRIALLEAASVAVQARTVAVMEAGLRLPTGLATGTGTDCVAVAAPPGAGRYAGLHTAAGEAAGRAVYDAVRRGASAWMDEMGRAADHAG
jgi:adenosylcobinamide amidohydrolase